MNLSLLNRLPRNLEILTGHKIRLNKKQTCNRYEERFALQRHKCRRHILSEYAVVTMSTIYHKRKFQFVSKNRDLRHQGRLVGKSSPKITNYWEKKWYFLFNRPSVQDCAAFCIFCYSSPWILTTVNQYFPKQKYDILSICSSHSVIFTNLFNEWKMGIGKWQW
jgi:hypothetical protein